MTPARPDRYEARTEIARRRQEQGLSQEELSAIAGITESTLYRLEAGTAENPGVVTLLALAEALHCNLQDLVHERWTAAARGKIRPGFDPRLPWDVRSPGPPAPSSDRSE